MAFVVYVLQSDSTGRIYIGQTSSIIHRLHQHNDPEYTLTLYTKRNIGPWKLVYTEEYPTRKEAMRREKKLKSGLRSQSLPMRLTGFVLMEEFSRQ